MSMFFHFKTEEGGAPPVVTANYPLDADAVEVSGVGYLPMTLSGGDQTATIALEGAPVSDRDAAAFPTGILTSTSQTMAFDVGAKAIEWEPIMPATVGGGAAIEAWRIEITHASVAFANIAFISLTQLADGTKEVAVLVGGMTYADTPASFPSRIGIAADSVTSTVRVYFDDVELVLPSNAYTPAESVILLNGFEKTDCPIGDAGKLIGATLYTAAADLIGTTYPSGTTDIGGNVI